MSLKMVSPTLKTSSHCAAAVKTNKQTSKQAMGEGFWALVKYEHFLPAFLSQFLHPVIKNNEK